MRCLSRFVSVAALAATAIANSYSRRWSARAIGFGDDHCFFLTILTRTPIGRSYIVSSRLLNAVRTLRSAVADVPVGRSLGTHIPWQKVRDFCPCLTSGRGK
jgi:hypothetical protein